MTRTVLAPLEDQDQPLLWKAILIVVAKNFPEYPDYLDAVFDVLPPVKQWRFADLVADAECRITAIGSNQETLLIRGEVKQENIVEDGEGYYRDVFHVVVQGRRWDDTLLKHTLRFERQFIVRGETVKEFEIIEQPLQVRTR